MRLTLVLGLIGLSALLFACSSDDSDSPAATATTAAASGGAATGSTVEVTLSDFVLALSADSTPAGAVTFKASNTGSTPHEVVVLKTDLEEDKLPLDGAQVDEGLVGAIGEVEEFPAGQKAEATFELAAGRYVLICNVAGHYQLGMHTVFTVE